MASGAVRSWGAADDLCVRDRFDAVRARIVELTDDRALSLGDAELGIGRRSRHASVIIGGHRLIEVGAFFIGTALKGHAKIGWTEGGKFDAITGPILALIPCLVLVSASAEKNSGPT